MPRALAGPGAGQAGRISWFGGPNDATTGSTTASGAPTSTPGIAVYNRATLGGWWLIKLPNGVITLVRQTDIGPAPWTGRTFDFTYSLLHFLGYNQSNFPTNGEAQGIYLGKAKNINALAASNGTQISNALAALGATPQQQNTLAGQIDTASGKLGANVIAIDPAGHPAADQSTTPSGDAQDVSIKVPNPLSGIDAIVAFLTDYHTWIRFGEAIAGVILIAMGLRSLTGSTTTPVTLAKAAVR